MNGIIITLSEPIHNGAKSIRYIECERLVWDEMSGSMLGYKVAGDMNLYFVPVANLMGTAPKAEQQTPTPNDVLTVREEFKSAF